MSTYKKAGLRTYKSEAAAQRYVDKQLKERFPLHEFKVVNSPFPGYPFVYLIKCVRAGSSAFPTGVYVGR